MNSYGAFDTTYSQQNKLYESAPTFDNNSPNSADSTDTVDQFPYHPNNSPNISPIPLHINPDHTMYGNGTSVIDKANYVKTSKYELHLNKIFNIEEHDQLSQREKIFSDIACGPYIFDIGYYIKTGMNDNRDNDELIITIQYKKGKRGTKRKASSLLIDGNSSKKRKLNNSRSQNQSYSNGRHQINGHHHDDDDNQSIPDKIDLLFKISVAGPSGNNHHVKSHKCTFGGDTDDLNFSDSWDNDLDSACNSYPNLNGFKVESFQDLAERFRNSMEEIKNSKKKKDKQYIVLQFELEIENVTINDSLSCDASKITYKRPKFAKRLITKFVGLRNEGATCYMNSMLQTLYHIAALRRNVYKIPVGHEAEQKKKKEELEKAKKKKLKKKIKNGADGGDGGDGDDKPKNDDDDNDMMSICEEEKVCNAASSENKVKKDNNDMVTSDDDDDDDEDEDEDDDIYRNNKKTDNKPPISLELQRLFYQLQTGAESNHQNEYEIHIDDDNNNNNKDDKDDNDNNDNNDNNDDDDDVLSDCSIFTLKSDEDFIASGDDCPDSVDDDDVDMIADGISDIIGPDNRWQSSYSKAVSTSNLIKSFGWSGSDSFVQHDVQEFLRVLMDKIEDKVKGTPAEKIVDKLFSGEYETYLECINVDFGKARKETFQDIQLTIPKISRHRGYGHNNCNAPDIYDCIRRFIKPERLEGDNQYFANDDLGKQDADKGVRFTKFPPVLFLQLCRFEMDNFQNTSKINDKLKFYQDIDLNPFIYVAPTKNNNGENKENVEQKKKEKKDEFNRYYNHLSPDRCGGSEFSYQLFSVLVHSGSTYGGHYFAYINPSGNKWYKFDDENVCIVSNDEATKKQFGGNSRQNAYMLVYIQKKYAAQILCEVNENDIPFELRRYFRKEKEKAQQQRLQQIENEKKCNVLYMNGHDIINNNNNNNDQYINVLDMGMKDLLQTRNIYKDIMMKELYNEWSEETNIPLNNLLIWNYTERKNKTLRANRKIQINLNEEYKSNLNEKQYNDDEIKRHLIKTEPTLKAIKSIYCRIGNVLTKKRSFILLDDRKINLIQNNNNDNDNDNDDNNNNNKTILVALKYFDIFLQKLYFVDWIMIKTKNTTIGDIANYMEKQLIPNTKDNRSYFEKLNTWIQRIDEFENNDDNNNNNNESNDDYNKKFVFYEEEAVATFKGTSNNPLCKIQALTYCDCIDKEYYDGDIFVFQLNPYHSYFNTLKPEITDIVDNNNNNDNDKKLSLPLYLKNDKFNFEKQGIYWYSTMDNFIKSQLNMTWIEIKIRDIGAWKSQWTKALLLQYKNSEKQKEIDRETRRKIIKFKHKWKIEKKTTYGMIRKKLGSYYNINPKHIEIWLPQKNTYIEKFDFGSNGRGKWKNKLEDLIKSRFEWKELCRLKFEIQTYDVLDFDRMTLYDNNQYNKCEQDNNNNNNNTNKYNSRIREMAMFNFEFITPNQCGPGHSNSTSMTISYCKNWSALNLIKYILKQIVEEPIFGYTFFIHIIKYIKKYEMNVDINNHDSDLLILQNLKPNRFLIIDESDNNLEQFYMNDKYKMPHHFSQIKYTDFRIEFLAKNDPLVLSENNNIDDIQTKALWVMFRKISGYNNNKTQKTGYNNIRCIIKRGQSLKDIIINYIIPYLKIDKNIENIMETHKFTLKGIANNNLNKEILENKNIFNSLNDEMIFIVKCPKQQKKSIKNYDRPLTING